MARIRVISVIFIIVSLLCITSAHAEDRWWVNDDSDGDWEGANNWSTIENGAGGAATPTSDDNVKFSDTSSSANCTLSAPSDCGGFFTRSDETGGSDNYTGTIDLNGQDLTVSGNFKPRLGTLSLGEGTLAISGDIDLTGGTLTAETSLLLLNGTGTQTITSSSQSFNNLQTNKSGNSVLLADDLSVGGNFTTTAGSGIIDAQAADVTVTGNFQCDNGSLDLGTGTWTVGGNWDTNGISEYPENTSTIIMTGSGKTLEATSGQDYYNLTISDSVTCNDILVGSGSGFLTVTGTLTIADGQYIAAQSAHTVTLGASGVINDVSTGYLLINNNPSAGIDTTNGTISCKVIFTEESAVKSRTYDNDVEIRGNAKAQLVSTGTLIINGNLDINAYAAGDITMNCATNDPIVDISGNLSFIGAGAGGEVIQAGDGTWNVAGNITFDSVNDSDSAGTFTPAASVFILDGAGTQTITSAGESFNNLQTAGSGTVVLADDLSVGGNFTATAGSTAFDAVSSDVAVTGNFQYDVGALDLGSGTWTVSGDWDTDGIGTNQEEGTSTVVLDGTDKDWVCIHNTNFYNVTIDGSITTNVGGGDGQDINGTLLINTGKTLTISSELTCDNGSTVTISGTIDGAGVLNVRGALGTGGVLNINNCDIEVPATTVPARTYGSNLRLVNTNSSAKTITLDSGTIIVSGDLSIGTYNAAADADLIIDASANNPDVDIGGNLDFIGTGTGDEIIQADGTWNVAGDINLSGGTLTAGTSVFILDGTSAQTITSAGESFNALTITNAAGTVTFADSATATTFTDTTPSSILVFDAGSTFTFTNISIDGNAAGTRIAMASTSGGSAWNFVVSGSPTVSYVTVSDSDASGGSEIDASDGTTDDATGNTNWDFGNYRYWVASSAATWNTTASWATASGGTSGAVVPGASDTAVFDGNGTNNCNIDTGASVSEVDIQSGYTGTITINSAQSLTTSATFSLADGIFDSNGESLTIVTYTQSGGTLTAGASTITCSGTWTNSGGVFTAGSSTVNFTNGHTGWTSGTVSYNNIHVNKSGDFNLTLSGTATVAGNLTLTDGRLQGDIAQVAGDVLVGSGHNNGGSATVSLNGSATQTVTSEASSVLCSLDINRSSNSAVLSGNLETSGSLTVTSGTFVPGSNVVTFSKGNNAAWTPGSETYYDVVVDKSSSSWSLTISGTANVSNNLTLTRADLNGGDVNLTGTLTISSTADGGTAKVILNGTGTQTIDSSDGEMCNLELNNTSNPVILSGDLSLKGNFTVTAGTFTVGSNTVTFIGGVDTTWTPGSEAYDDVVMNKSNSDDTVTISGTTDIDGTLTLTNGNLNSGTVTVAGDVTYISTYDAGSTAITLDGTGTQTVTLSTTTTQTSLLTINKSTGTAVMTGTGTLYDITVTQGTLDFDGGFTYTVTTGDTWTVASSATIGFTGAIGSHVTLSAAGTWNLDNQSTSTTNADYVDVTYSNASNTVTATNSVDSGNNTNWTFSSSVRYWVAAAAATWNTADSWSTSSGGSSGASVPGATTHVIFDANGTQNCTVDTAASISQFTNTGGYSGTFDADTYNVTIANDFQFDGGVLDLGSGTWAVTGNWDTSGVNFNAATSTIVLDGTSKNLVCIGNEILRNLTISGSITRTTGNLSVNGGVFTVSSSSTFTLASTSWFQIYNSATSSIAGVMEVDAAAFIIDKAALDTGGTITTTTGAIRFGPNNDTDMPARRYDGNVEMSTNRDITVTTLGGTITINGDLAIEQTGANTLILDASANNTNFDISGDIAFAGTGAGGEVILAGTGTWNAGGDVTFDSVNDGDSAGTFTPSSSVFVLDGTSAQTITSAGESFNHLTVTNDSSATVTFADNTTASGTFTAATASSIMVFNAGSTFTFTDLTLNGQATGTRVVLRSSSDGSKWNLVSTGVQSVSNTDVQDSDADGGDLIDASDGTSFNAGNNDNWNFPVGSTTAFTDDSYNDVSNYTTGSKIYVTVVDADENTITTSAQTFTVTVTSPAPASDSETITLTEITNNSGTFINLTGLTFTLYSSPANTDDGNLEVDVSDITITASYTDDNDATDTSSDTATATVSTTSTTSFTDVNGTDIDEYLIGDSIYVTVTDTDEDTGASSQETVTTTVTSADTGDSVTLTLTETGNNTGTFRNTTALSFDADDAADSTNSTLETRDEDTITATYTDDDDGTDSTSDTATINAGKDLMVVTTSVEPQKARIGDILNFTATIKNQAGRTMTNFQLINKLPPISVYRAGSGKYNNAVISPSGKNTLQFSISSLANNVTNTLKFQAIIGSAASPGKYTNAFYAQINPVISNTSLVTITITPDPLFTLGILIGKVFDDKNESGYQDRGELGIPNVKLATEEGTVVITDNDGKFHVPDVLSGRHLLKIDLTTLPPGSVLTTDKVRLYTATDAILNKVNFGVKLPADAKMTTDSKTTVMVNQVYSPPKRVLNIKYNGAKRKRKDQKAEKPKLLITTNYAEFIKFWRLRFLNKRGKEVKTLEGSGPPPPEIELRQLGLRRGQYKLILSVYDDKQRKDEAEYILEVGGNRN